MDEADKLLSPEFQPVLEGMPLYKFAFVHIIHKLIHLLNHLFFYKIALINQCAPERQICLFSATFPVTVKVSIYI